MQPFLSRNRTAAVIATNKLECYSSSERWADPDRNGKW